MLACLFERKIFSATISDPSTFFMKTKDYFFIKKWILKGIPVEKMAMQKIYSPPV